MSRAIRQSTSTVLLESLKDPAKETVWTEFDARYRPVLIGFGRSVGLGATDAEEVAQETLAEFVKSYRNGKYDRSRGRLSSWIVSIARHRIAGRWRQRARRGPQRGESALVDLSSRTRVSKLWAVERDRAIFARAMEQLRTKGRLAERTLKAFELVAMRGVPAAAAAVQCGMTLDEVYVAKNRVTNRLREIVEELTAAYGEDG